MGDSLQEKTNPLQLDKDQKLSLVLGLSSFGSSGKYLQDRKSSNSEVRASLICNCCTHYKQITLPPVVENLKTLDNTAATHIVVGIQYGAKVVFMFERTVSKSEDERTIRNELQNKMTLIPFIAGKRSGQSQHGNEKEKRRDEQISCKFFGDLILPVNPTTYVEAVDLYKELPSYIKRDKAVPVRVWLYPLSNLKQERQEIYKMSSLNVEKLQWILEYLDHIEVKCNDIMQTYACNLSKLPQIQNRIVIFSKYLKLYRQLFQEKLATTLTTDMELAEKIRAQIREEHDNSPFAACHLDAWIKSIITEIKYLCPYTDELVKVGISEDHSDLANKKFKYDRLIVLNVVLPLHFEKLPTEMQSFIESRYANITLEEIDESDKVHPRKYAYESKEEQQLWYSDDKILLRLRKCIKEFVQFSEENTDEDLTCTALIYFENSTVSTQCIRLEYYLEGQLKNKSWKGSLEDILRI